MKESKARGSWETQREGEQWRSLAAKCREEGEKKKNYEGQEPCTETTNTQMWAVWRAWRNRIRLTSHTFFYQTGGVSLVGQCRNLKYVKVIIFPWLTVVMCIVLVRYILPPKARPTTVVWSRYEALLQELFMSQERLADGTQMFPDSMWQRHREK